VDRRRADLRRVLLAGDADAGAPALQVGLDEHVPLLPKLKQGVQVLVAVVAKNTAGRPLARSGRSRRGEDDGKPR